MAWADPSPPARRYVNSVDDFKLHTRAHVQRVERIGLELLRRFPDEFRGVDPKRLSVYLRIHDRAKDEMSARLYRFYGRPGHALSPQEKAEFRSTVDELNLKDGQYVDEFLGQERLGTALKFRRIEKIADSVDRALSPVSREEFGREMEPASRFLKGEADARLARYMETPGVYERIVAGATFDEVKSRAVRRLLLKARAPVTPRSCLKQAFSWLENELSLLQRAEALGY